MAQMPVAMGRQIMKAVYASLGRVIAVARFLVLPLSLLLFLQWPLREWVQAYSRESNDLAQCLFAIYVSLAVTYATRSKSHLAVDAWAHRLGEATRKRLARGVALCALLPWSLFIIYAGWSMTYQSIVGLEKFPETFNPGYFLVKSAAMLLALIVALQSVLDVICDPDGEQE